MSHEEELMKRGQALYSERQYAEALPFIEELISLGHTSPQMRIFKSQCLLFTNRAPEAVSLMSTVLAEDPLNPEYNLIMAQYLRAVGEFDASYARMLNASPDMAGYPMLMGWHKMRQGDFLGAFRLFQNEPGIIQLGDRLEIPREKLLKKGTDIRGKRILYLMEGGFGDEILFSRFAQTLRDRGAQVVVGASSRVIEILQNSLYAKDARPLDTISPDEYDWCVPALFSIDLFDIEDPMKGFSFPYLFPDKNETARWKPILENEAAGRKKIGIHWQGNWSFDHLELKSPPAHLMLKFADSGKLFSLQRDAGGNSLPPGAPVFDAEAGPPSWGATAAVINEMDYVVTNDTSVAHLAGALGKKTLVLLPHAPHFYWVMKEHEAIWYPDMYLFRQPTYNDWPGAIEAAYTFIERNA